MIKLTNVSKGYPTRDSMRWVLEGINFRALPHERWAILGCNGSGKSTLIRLIGRTESPTCGSIENTCSVSWPLAFGGGFQGGLTGANNVALISQIYDLDERQAMNRVEAFAELGCAMTEPVASYSDGMRARLAFGLSLAVDFEFMLIDEMVTVGDQRFRDKCRAELHEKRRGKGFILVSHDLDYVRQFCSHAAVLDGGRLRVMSSVQEAIELHAECSERASECQAST